MMEGEAAPAGPVASPTPGASTEAKRAPVRSHWVRAGLLRLIILALAVGVLFLLATRWDVWVGLRSRQTTDDAYVRGDITPLSAQVEGYVRLVAVGDFQMVKAGDLLVQIDDDDYQARAAQAEADLLGAEAAIQNLKARKDLQHAEIDQAQREIEATQADVDRTVLELRRQRALLATTYGTAQKVEQATAEEKRFEATLAGNQAELQGARRQMGVLDTENRSFGPRPRPRRRCSTSPRSISAIPGSWRR